MTVSKQAATTRRKAATTRELAHREALDIEVSLFWRPADDSIVLLLVEVPTGVVFEVPVASEDALDAFNHPYAYLPADKAEPRPELLAA